MRIMNELWLLDTHIWIRLLNGDPVLKSAPFLNGIRKREEAGKIRIAAITLWETAMLVSKGRLSLSMPVREWLEQAVTMPGLSVFPLTPEIAADSCFLPGVFHGDPADRLITASSRVHSATLITFDKAILEYAAEGWVKAVNPLSL